MRNLIILLLLILLICIQPLLICPASQSMRVTQDTKGLLLRGKVLQTDLAADDKHGIEFHARLSLELFNDGDKSVIILLRKPWLGALTLSRSPGDAAASRFLYLSSAWPSLYRGVKGSKWEELQQQLDQQSPPLSLTRSLAAGESFQYETEATLYIEKAGSVDRTSLPWEVIRQASPVWLQVSIEVWPINVEPKVDPDNLEFGKTLQNRWQRFGKLQLERLTSEPMPLSFPSSP